MANKIADALASMTLGGLAGSLILLAPGLPAKTLGCIAGISALSVHQRKALRWADYSETTDWLMDEVGASLTELAIVPSFPPIAQRLAVKMLPPKYRSQAETLLEAYTDTDWLDEALSKALIVCGSTGDGKTILLQYLVAYLLQANPETELTIVDPDYGSSHGDSEPNTWLGLPPEQFIVMDEGAGAQVFLDAAKLVKQRSSETSEAIRKGKTKPRYYPRLVVTDEALDVLDSDSEDFPAAIRLVLFRGLKQKVRAVWGVQSLLCKQLHLDETQINQVNIVLLGRAAYDKQNLNKLGLTSGKADEAIARLKQIRKMPGCQRACLARINGEISIRVIPHIDLSQLVVELPEQADPIESWWSEVVTPEAIAKVQALIKASPGSKQTRIQAMAAFGLIETNCRRGRPHYERYQRFKQHYDDWTKQATIAVSSTPVDSSVTPEVQTA